MSDIYDTHLGDHSTAGDYNGDGRDDIVCHDRIDGQLWVDLANSSGEFFGTNSYENNDWCRNSSGRLYKGDFNGDGRTDLLCHSLANGSFFVDYADAGGQFEGTDWSRSANWCKSSGAYLHIGDFDGDGRDDLLCHNRKTGWKHIDYANNSGQFNGTNWSNDNDWCTSSGGRLHIGKFNGGDQRDDLLCHNVENGWIHIDYANNSGQFNGTNWSTDNDWCIAAGADLRIGDYNGDGYDDMLCHNAINGWKHIDYSHNGFAGTDWSRDAEWCRLNGARLVIGDFNGDNRDDMLCHNLTTGWKSVDYANGSGQFNGTDWDRDAQWCRADGSKLH